MANVLIIDDDEKVCDILARVVKDAGHQPVCAINIGDGLDQAHQTPIDVIFLDVNLPDGSGLDALPLFRQGPSAPDVIIFTGQGNPDGAELAIKNGAWDYVQKPVSPKEIRLQLTRALEYREIKQSTKRPVLLQRSGIVGSSAPMKACLNLVAQAAHSDSNVLITGETGTGKELFARAIHNNSPRAEKHFAVVDCAALPETLVESVLFGHVKGSFTGADRASDGLVKQADGGTLFLDEVGELPLNMQKAFLRVLQEHRFRPVGAKREEKSDFRLVAATNRDLDQMVRQGLFRDDLLFRLRSLSIELPPLRDHAEDIRELAIYYVNKLCENYQTATKGFSPEFLGALRAYDWPGNVRELYGALEKALTAAQDETILFPMDLPTQIRIKVARSAVDSESSQGQPGNHPTSVPAQRRLPSLKEYRQLALDGIEKKYLRELVSTTEADINDACTISGLSRSRLYGLLKKHGMSKLH